MTEYIERKANDAKEIVLDEMFSADQLPHIDSDNTVLLDFLKENYPYLYEAMVNEKYIIEENICPFFREVIYDSKVVGFYTYEYITDILTNKICINEFYVVPEYRGNKIFIKTLKNMIAHSEYDGVLLRNPSRLIIEIMLENQLATRFSKNLVRTGINWQQE